jgi:cytochrome c5
MMMNKSFVLCFIFILLSGVSGFSQTENNRATTTARAGQQPAKSTVATSTHERDGQQVFDQNCSRCHTTPQGFSPRISGTVARHMRVRAGLSQEDEQALLRFLNP